MIVVAIIGILVAIAIPQYQNYVARAQAAEGFSLAGGLKTALAEYHNTKDVFPDGTTDAHAVIGIEPAGNIIGKYITGVEVSDDGLGTITATFGSDSYHDGRFLRLTPTATDGAMFFTCTTDIEESYRPKDCEDGTGDPIEEKSGPSINNVLEVFLLLTFLLPLSMIAKMLVALLERRDVVFSIHAKSSVSFKRMQNR